MSDAATTNVFEARTYRGFLEAVLRIGQGEQRRGVNKLASAIGCHPTYIAKVLQGKADFSMEQTARFIKYQQLSPDEGEYFLDLVLRDRAGDQITRSMFQRRLTRRLAERSNIKAQLRESEELPLEQQVAYYDTWVPQALHVLVQTAGRHTVDSIATRLGINREIARKHLAQLNRMGILAQKKDDLEAYVSTVDFVHVSNESPLVNQMHANWRQKTAADLAVKPREDALHFSGVLSADRKTVAAINQKILAMIREANGLIKKAPSENVYFLGFDLTEL